MTAVRDKNGSSTNLNWGYGPFAGCTALKKLNVPGAGALLADASLMGNYTTDAHLTELTVRCNKSSWNTLISSYKLQPVLMFADTIKLNDGTLNPATDLVCNCADYDIYGDGNLVIKGTSLSALTYAATRGYLPYIKTLTIPSGVTKVADNVTDNLSALTSVIFQGTEAEWKAVTIGAGNSPLKNATVSFHVHTPGASQVIAPTCTGQGYTTSFCTSCGKECGNRTNYTEATGHLHTSSVTTFSPTCVKEGECFVTCSDCGAYWDEVLPIDPEAHSFPSTFHVDATCTEAGYWAEGCTLCKKVFTLLEEIPALGHDYAAAGQYSNGQDRKLCTRCQKSNISAAVPNFFSAMMVDGEDNLAMISWMDAFYHSEVEILCSTDGGATWSKATVKDKGDNDAWLTVKSGKTYQFKLRYKWTYTYNGTSGTEYSGDSDILTVKVPGTEVPDVEPIPVTVKITGITNVSGGQKVIWSSNAKTAGATGVKYTLLEDASKGTTPKTTVTSTTATSATCTKNNVNGKKHTYAVKCTYTDSNGTKQTVTSAKYCYYYLTRPSLTYYKNISAGKIKLTWKQNTAASGYQVKYVTGTTTKTLTISGNKTVTKTLTKLKKGKTYKCYVRAYKTVSGKKYYSAWSSYKSVKVTK